VATKRKILIHVCCSACASYVFAILEKEHFDITALFFNPELESKKEFERRLADVTNLCQERGVKLVVPEHNSSLFSSPLEPYLDKNSIKYISDKDRFRRKRCELCLNLLINYTVTEARKMKFKYFTTTMLCSPYKDHNQIWDIGVLAAENCNMVFSYQDFRKGYWTGRNFARNHEMMIPAFCGCDGSLSEGRLE